jgi:acyl-CoA hydrolase
MRHVKAMARTTATKKTQAHKRSMFGGWLVSWLVVWLAGWLDGWYVLG